MKLVRQTKLQFREGNSDKIYEVDLCETGEKYVVNFRYGKRGANLKEGTKTTNAIALEDAEKIFKKLVDEKVRKGYHVAAETDKTPETAKKPNVAFIKSKDENERNRKLLEKLQEAHAPSNPKIERVIWRVGELKIKEAAPHLAKLIGTANELRDYCIAWSLGFCGDEASISDLEKLAAHKADHVRRISREAMAKIAGETTRNELEEAALSKLPENLQNFIKNKDAKNLENALREEMSQVKDRGFDVLTRLYEIDDETTRPILLELLREIPLKVNFFKPVRQIFKIAEYRRDAEVFGILAKRFETSKAGFHSSPWGNWVGLRKDDGSWEYIRDKKSELARADSRIAFGNQTKDYFQKRTWRTLRRLGEIGDAEEYVNLAVGSLLQFSDADALEPKKSIFYDYRDENGNWNWQNPKKLEIYWDKFSAYLLFNHILYENSPRYEHKTGSRGFRLKDGHTPEDESPKVREEAFPKIWEQNPRGLLHLLAESECEPVHEFAVKALRDCREFVESFDVEVVLMLLSRPYKVTARFGFEIAKKIYDPGNPNVELAVAVATSSDAEARAEGFRWIDQTRELFAKDSSILLKLFTSKFSDTRKFAANLLQTAAYSETEAKNLIAVLISELISFDEEEREIAAGLSEAMLKGFGGELRTLNFETIQNLLAHSLVEVQEFGGNILLNHEISAEKLPDALINSLIESEFESIRNIGVKLFGKLLDENLLKRESVIVSLLSHELADVYNSIRPIALRLASKRSAFAKNISNSIFVSLLQQEKREGIRSQLLNFLKDLPDWTNFAEFETAKMLVYSNFA